ncbi:MAG: 3'(2'),5'-bisphosphate nucleotidase CysQ [Pseudomonadota bacterium]
MDITAAQLPENMPDDLALLAEIGAEAGRIAMSFFGKNPQVWVKGDDSPVSEGDLAVDKYLRETLLAARPDHAWLSEETTADDARLSAKRAFVVDPIDGTRAYVSGGDVWGVSIGLVEDGRPVAAAFVCPVLGETYLAAAGFGAFLNGQPLAVRSDDTALPVAGPARMRDAIKALETSVSGQWPHHIPSLAYRLVMVARGQIRAAFARRDSHDWDIAAADLILAETGCELLDIALDGTHAPITYNSENFKRGVLYCAPEDAASDLLQIAKHMAGQSGKSR